MAEMSPLARVLMGILQKGSWFAAGLLALFAGILLFQRWTPDGLVLQQGDTGFLIVLGLLFLLAIYLVRGIKKEVDDHS
jgi:prepilin signal peptidase PulO-like enzyme (type II secretory pathway)